MKFSRLLFFCVFVLAVACSVKPAKLTDDFRDPDRLIFSDKTELNDRPSLTSAQVQEDLDVLLYALRWGYGGRHFIDQKKFSIAIQQLERVAADVGYPATSRELLEKIDRILLSLPDNHLHIRSDKIGFSEIRRSTERTGMVGKNLLEGNDKPWGIKRISANGSSFPVLSIRALPSKEDAAWEGFKVAVEEWLSKPTVILDLRGNGGGSDEIGSWLASRVKGSAVESPYEYVVKSNTPETFALAINNLKLKIFRKTRSGKRAQEYLVRKLNEKLIAYNSAKSRMADSFDRELIKIIGEDPKHKPFKGNVYILVDAECASSCESIVEFFEKIPNAVTVGENTAGSVHFGNMGLLILPNSQLIVQMATDFWKYRDNRFVEKVGYPPKTRVPAGQDALKFLLKQIALKASR